MIVLRRLIAVLCLLPAFVLGAFAQDDDEPGFGERFGAALGQTAAVNGVLFSFDRFVLNTDYSRVNLGTIENNLGSVWAWDQDEFLVNQIGHPYQGSYYFASGRANGIPF